MLIFLTNFLKILLHYKKRMPQKANILTVDDEARIRDSLASLLLDQGYDIHTAESGEQALSLINKKTWDIALFDYIF